MGTYFYIKGDEFWSMPYNKSASVVWKKIQKARDVFPYFVPRIGKVPILPMKSAYLHCVEKEDDVSWWKLA